MTAKPLTVRELIVHLMKMKPEMKLVYAVDDEGNSFHPVYHSPTKMKVKEFADRLYPHEQDAFGGDKEVLCIN